MNSRTRMYLDTSSVRRIGGRLKDLKPIHHFRTSAWTFVELLNGLRSGDDDFRRRSGAIRNLIDSGLYITWELPEARLASAFTALDGEDDRIEPLRQIIDVVMQSNDRMSFVASIGEGDLLFYLEYFEKYDTNFGSRFAQATSDSTVREAFEREVNNPASLLPEKVLNGSYQDFCRFMMDGQSPLGFGITLYAIALMYALALGCPSDTDRIHRKVFDSYTEAVDPYIMALSTRSMLCEINGGPPERNDFADLAHFLYVTKSVTLVTEDCGFKELAEAIGIPVTSIDSRFARTTSV